MAKPRRILRLQQLILEVAAQTLQREIQDPRLGAGLVSITRIKLSPDLSRAQIYWSCLGSEGQQRTTERGLEDALPVIQRAVARALTTRVTPKLSLHRDDTMEKAARLEEIFHKLKVERGDVPDTAAEESSADASTENAPTDGASSD